MSKTLTIVAALAASLCLSACGSAPNDADIQAALSKQLSGAGGAMASEMYKEQIAKIKVIQCAKADAGGYKCDFSNGSGGAGSGRFVKSNDGWVVIGQGG